MSEMAARRLNSATPSSDRRLRVIEALLRASDSQASVESARSVGVPKRRNGSPLRGSSTLITSAPNSLRIVAQ
jgi:hypothetical protein